MATNVSAPLPDLTLEQKSVLVVDSGDAGAPITRLVIHFSQQVPDVPVKISLVPPILAHEAPGLTR